MRQALISIKRNLKNKGKLFLPVLFLALFLFPVNAFADYRTGYQDFICLFTPTERNCDHSSPESAVKRAEKSGLAYGKTVKDGITSTGIKKIILQLGFSLNPDKDIRDGSNSESRYFYKRVADPRSNSFFVRLKYTPGLNGEAVSYQFSPIAYSIYNNSVATGNFTITGDTIKGDAYTSGQLTSIAFYKERSGGDLMISQSVVSKEITFDSEIVFNSTRKIEADLWYCGGESTSGENVDGRYSPRDGIRVEYFTTDGKYEYKNDPNDSNKIDGDHGIEYPFNLCDKEAAYKIGETIDLSSKLPKTQEAANIDAEQNINSGVVSTAYTGSVMPQCHILNGWGPGSGSFMACISNVFYYLVFKPIAWLAWLLGQIFDFFIGYSLSDESYRHNFVQTGWQLVRDISNIFFIIIMIYSGLAAVFSTSNVSYKKVIPTLIINALIINFSLFATRIVIDMSNITARLFYNQIEVCQKDDFGECVSDSGPGGFKPISESIISSFNPQKIIQNANLLNTPSAPEFNPDAATDGSQGDFNSAQNINGNFNNNPGDGSLNTEGLSRSDTEYAAYFGLIALIMAMIAFGTAMMFWKTAFMFVGRVIGLYVAMIFSPFAFLSRGNVPLVSKIPTLNYGSWWKDLTNYALLAPIFVFFLYIISAFLKADFINGLGLNQNTSNFFEAALYVVIPMLIIYGLVTRGVKIANDLAGDFGKMVQEKMSSVGGAVVGGALGIATGGVAVAGRNVIGRLGSRLASSQTLQNASSRGGILGGIADRTIRSGNYLSRATYDARNNNFVGSRLREFGNNNSIVGRITGTNQANTTGGFQGAIQREAESQNRRADRTLLTGEQAATQDARNTAWENTYQTARNNAQQQANSTGVTFDENNFRTTYLATQATAGNTRPETSAEINRRREQQNNARLQRGSTLARIARRASNRITTPTGVGGGVTTGAGLAAGAVGAAAAGGLATAAAAIVGEGAIQGAAQQQVARQRSSNARDPISPTQRTNLQNRLAQLQAELTRRISLMNTIGSTFNPPITYNNLTPANVIDYQTNRQTDINSRQTQIDNEQDFVDRNKNNPAMSARVNQARSNIRNLTNQQNNLRNDIRQAGNVLNEFNRIQTDINGIRTQLGI